MLAARTFNYIELIGILRVPENAFYQSMGSFPIALKICKYLAKILTKLAFNFERGLTICHHIRRQAAQRQVIRHGRL